MTINGPTFPRKNAGMFPLSSFSLIIFFQANQKQVTQFRLVMRADFVAWQKNETKFPLLVVIAFSYFSEVLSVKTQFRGPLSIQ